MSPRLAALCVAGLLSACGHRDEQVTLRQPDTSSRLNVAAAAAASGQTDIALSMYSAAATAAPDSIEAQTKYANLLLKVGKPEMADQVLTRALAQKPDDPTLLRWRGMLLLEIGDTRGAMEIFDKLLSRNQRDIAALNGRGMALDIADRHADAEQAYRTALSIAPNDIQSANNLAICLLLLDRSSEARDILLPLSQRPDAPPRVLNNLAVAQGAAGDLSSSNALLSGRPGAEDIRALATAFGAPAAADEPPPPEPASGRTPRNRPTG